MQVRENSLWEAQGAIHHPVVGQSPSRSRQMGRESNGRHNFWRRGKIGDQGPAD
jgi:hypothetical protein